MAEHRVMRLCLVLILLLSTFHAAVWATGGPFDPKWEKALVIWDFRKNDLICHGHKAQLVGEE